MKLDNLTSETIRILLRNERNQNVRLFNGSDSNRKILLQTPYVILGYKENNESIEAKELIATKCVLRNINNTFQMSRYCGQLMSGYLDTMSQDESSRLSGLPLHGYLDGSELRSRQLGKEADVSKRLAERRARFEKFNSNFPLSEIVLQFPYCIIGDNSDPFDLFVGRPSFDPRQLVPNEINFYCSGFLAGVLKRKEPMVHDDISRTMEYFLAHGYLDGKDFAERWKPVCNF